MPFRTDSSSQPGCCGVATALETMGERWSFMILRAAFDGVCHFEGFLKELGIARNILSNRLSRLVDNGVLVRSHCCGDRRRIEYCLTDKGRDLLPVMVALRNWGERWQHEPVDTTAAEDCLTPKELAAHVR